MKITIKQCEHKEIKIIENVLYLDNETYKAGEIIIGFIDDNYIEGRLLVLGRDMYFLQNTYNGSRPERVYDFYGFKYSWSFSEGANSFSSGLNLFNYKKEKDFNIEELELKYPLPSFAIDKYSVFRQLSSSKNLFNLSPIAECCGATLLCYFRRDGCDNEYLYSESEVNEINQYLKNSMTSNKIAYLLKENESQAISFLVEKLNFKIIDEFKNSNTGNYIQILSRNDI